MDNPEVGKNNSSISFDNSTQNNNFTQNNNSTQNKESGQIHTDVVASQGNLTIQGIKNSELRPPTVSDIENEGSELSPLKYENNYRGVSSNEDNNSESRDRDSEIDKEIKEEKELEEDNKDAETIEEVEEDNKEAESIEEEE